MYDIMNNVMRMEATDRMSSQNKKIVIQIKVREKRDNS